MGDQLSDNVKVYVKLEKLTGQLEVQNEINSKILEGQDRLYDTVYGENGLQIKTDRLHQAHKQSKWIQGLISVPVIGWLVNYIIDFFSKAH